MLNSNYEGIKGTYPIELKYSITCLGISASVCLANACLCSLYFSYGTNCTMSRDMYFPVFEDFSGSSSASSLY